MTKTARWLDLIAYLLQHRYPVSREEIFRRVRGYGVDPDHSTRQAVESARRKFERDKDELRDLGVRIETVGDDAGTAYRLRSSGFYLPYFELDDQAAAHPYPELQRIRLTRHEARVLDRATRHLAAREEFPLAEAAKSLRKKLAFDLPISEAAVERVLAEPLPPEAQQSLETLQRAVAERRAVRCTYYSLYRDEEATREIEPWGLYFDRSHWYCVARARDRDAARVFRVDRMREARLLADTFPVPGDFDVRSYLGRRPWELGEGVERIVRVRFGFPQSRWVLNEGRGRVVEPLLEDGGSVIEFTVRDVDAFLRWVLTFGAQARILEPPDAVTGLEALRARVAELYER